MQRFFHRCGSRLKFPLLSLRLLEIGSRSLFSGWSSGKNENRQVK
ncbi:MAG: hypothetical protein ACI8RD_003922, partial [Bacillariaceae sp.]